MEIIEIAVPSGWTADQDIEDFTARFGEADNMQQLGIDAVESAYEELNRAG